MGNLRNRIIAKIRQRLSLYQLMFIREPDISITTLDCVDLTKCTIAAEFEIVIFGKKIDYNTINWHCDYNSGYCYPAQKRFDKIKINKLFNKGIDVIFAWELSRFNFGIDLALFYHQSNDLNYYDLFKKLTTNWLENNPFLKGVNWICAMDVALRASNWIVAANMFDDIFWKDKTFVHKLSKSLYHHACYIEKFQGEYLSAGNNHLISINSSLFILALSFTKIKKGNQWFQIAKTNLELCMENLVFNDGVYFENAIPYHRLALELFSIPVILSRNFNLAFSTDYYIKLFKMVEFVSAYIDSKGNAPLIGDNDSGKFLKLSHGEEQNHQYLLELGQQIFEYNFKTDNASQDLIPIFKKNRNKINLSRTGINPRECNHSIFFTDGGFYFLKNALFSISVFCPTTNVGGHRHFDAGSFTLSHKGKPIVVDPGTGVYTSNIQTRRRFRDYSSHNIYYREKQNVNNNAYFGINDDLDVKIVHFSENKLIVMTNFENDLSVERQFILNEQSFHIHDTIHGDNQKLFSAIHLSEKETGEIINKCLRVGELEIEIDGAKGISKEHYLYSPSYSILLEREKIVIQPDHMVKINFISK